MKTIIGIGNPGKKYEKNRHSAGFMFVDSLKDSNFKTFKSDEFMNSSGKFVQEKVNFFKIDLDDLYIAHDDLDIKLGEFKITKKSPKVHNGITSVNNELGTQEYWKIRIGVDNRDPLTRMQGNPYVMSDFESEELEILKTVFEKIKQELNG